MSEQSSPKLIQRWENLEMGLQFLIAFIVLIPVIALLHWTALNQPLARGAVYGVFWALPAAFLVAVASQNERRKRRDALAAKDDPGDSSPPQI
jgi:purine-cytosine permease-like protein